MIHSAEVEIDLTRLCDMIGGCLYLANQVREIGFDSAKSTTAIGGATMYAGYAEAHPVLDLGMLSIPKIWSSQINFLQPYCMNNGC
jgi:hypothetical protein